ncbi:MAG: hypothetical protein PUB87_00635 [Eubacteriaceae bacterium]|nr:hypothetical protein [Eubacteriaceae bacterium]
MFKNNQYVSNVEIHVMRYGKRKKQIVKLAAWDIPSIAFLAVKESNDYRYADKVASLGQLVALYRKYENEHSSAVSIENAEGDDVFRVVLGMTAEQFKYQNLYQIFEKFNRDYYLLLAAKDFDHRSEIDTNAIVTEVFGYSADDYVTILITVFYLCEQHPNPLHFIDNLHCRQENLKNPVLIAPSFQKSGTVDSCRMVPVGSIHLLGDYTLVTNQVKAASHRMATRP